MIIDRPHSIDSLKDGTKEVADFAHEKANLLSTHFDSKVTPHLGRYGNVAKFAAELVPGVAEYHAIKEGDWKGFAIAAGIDIGAIAVGAFSAGAGYASIKGGSALARAGVKAATKEIAETGAKNTAKEIAEFSAKKAVKETVDAGTETAARKAANEGIEKAMKETTDAGIGKVERKVLKVGDKIDTSRFPEYYDDIEKITGREIPKLQKDLIEKAIQEKDFFKLSVEDTRILRNRFNSNRPSLISEWEQMTGKEWPRYTEDVINEQGVVIRYANQPYDAHHIIELNVGGPNEWWNLHPARFPEEHQNGIHEGIAKEIFG